MEPLSADIKQKLKRKGVDTNDIEEYEKLLSERFTVDSTKNDPESLDASSKREKRIAELHKKLFGQ